MIELLLFSTCLSLNFKGEGCSAAFNGYMAYNQTISNYEHKLDRQYIQPLPDEFKVAGGVTSSIYRKEFKFVLFRGFYVDFRDQGRSSFGYQHNF